ncbi:MAG TPA: hypothetical protein VFL10_17250 [Ornithinibacter sp.]|nr:hypothetical protein [Ornithinibacter sp.]
MTSPLPRRTALRSAAAVMGVAVVGAVAACTGTDPVTGDATDGARPESTPQRHALTPGRADRAGTLDPRTRGGDAAATVAASRALLEAASVVVVTSDEPGDLAAGTAAARRLGIPLFVDGPGLADELDRLGTRTVLRWSVTAPPGSPSPSSGAPATGGREVIAATDVDDLPELPGLPLQPPRNRATVLLREGAKVPPSLAATLAAVGADPVTVTGTDPRTADDARDALRTALDTAVLAVGAGFGASARFAHRVRTARHAHELPGGGLLPFPGRRMVALYGHPRTAALGMLGEQSAQASVRRAAELAQQYAALVKEPVVPAFELIATVAAGAPQEDGSYSRRTPVRALLPWVEAAEQAGTYVVLDLQPGRDDFLTQAKAYEELLRRPWVGLALDPEWRLQPGEKPLRQIGHVGIDEVNAVGAWLAALVREHDLPPKVLTLHQFRPSMVRDRDRLDTSLDEVQWLVHADGQGGQNAKQGTWSALRRDLPEGVWLGWKNFEDEDTPMLTPEQTVAQVHPTPFFVSYQ